MPPRRNNVRVVGQDDLRDLVRDLRQQADGKRRVRELGKGLRAAARPINQSAKQAARGLPSQNQNKRRGRPSLRREMAKSVTTQVKLTGRSAGVRVYMNLKKMPDGKKTLPRYVEGVPRWTRWRHPVFGNTDKWVTQRSTPFFTRATAQGELRAREAVGEVIDRTVRDLEQ